MTTLLVLLGAVAAWWWFRHGRRQREEARGARMLADMDAREWDAGDRDDWEGSFWEVEAPRAVAARLHLKYRDGQGNPTRRLVDVRQFGAYGPTTLLIGHCHLRNATRTFRADHIHEASDADTGEVLDDVAGWLRARYDASPEASADRLADDAYDALRVLLYVGKADGQLRAAERERIAAACRTLSGDARVTPELVGGLLAQMDVPTLPAFKLAVGRLAARDATVARTVLEASAAIVATQKTVHHAEADALAYMRQRFAIPA